ncbi:hypothetical protein AMTRI_Chr06g177190 [Amborella trichopoda]
MAENGASANCEMMMHPVFINTSIDTHITLLISSQDTVEDLKRKLSNEHHLCFPDIGEITIHALKMKMGSHLYQLPNSMMVQPFFQGKKGAWFLYIDACPVNPVKSVVNSKDHLLRLENGEAQQKSSLICFRGDATDSLDHVSKGTVAPSSERDYLRSDKAFTQSSNHAENPTLLENPVFENLPLTQVISSNIKDIQIHSAIFTNNERENSIEAGDNVMVDKVEKEPMEKRNTLPHDLQSEEQGSLVQSKKRRKDSLTKSDDILENTQVPNTNSKKRRKTKKEIEDGVGNGHKETEVGNDRVSKEAPGLERNAILDALKGSDNMEITPLEELSDRMVKVKKRKDKECNDEVGDGAKETETVTDRCINDANRTVKVKKTRKEPANHQEAKANALPTVSSLGNGNTKQEEKINLEMNLSENLERENDFDYSGMKKVSLDMISQDTLESNSKNNSSSVLDENNRDPPESPRMSTQKDSHHQLDIVSRATSDSFANSGDIVLSQVNRGKTSKIPVKVKEKKLRKPKDNHVDHADEDLGVHRDHGPMKDNEISSGVNKIENKAPNFSNKKLRSKKKELTKPAVSALGNDGIDRGEKENSVMNISKNLERENDIDVSQDTLRNNSQINQGDLPKSSTKSSQKDGHHHEIVIGAALDYFANNSGDMIFGEVENKADALGQPNEKKNKKPKQQKDRGDALRQPIELKNKKAKQGEDIHKLDNEAPKSSKKQPRKSRKEAATNDTNDLESLQLTQDSVNLEAVVTGSKSVRKPKNTQDIRPPKNDSCFDVGETIHTDQRDETEKDMFALSETEKRKKVTSHEISKNRLMGSKEEAKKMVEKEIPQLSETLEAKQINSRMLESSVKKGSPNTKVIDDKYQNANSLDCDRPGTGSMHVLDKVNFFGRTAPEGGRDKVVGNAKKDTRKEHLSISRDAAVDSSASTRSLPDDLDRNKGRKKLISEGNHRYEVKGNEMKSSKLVSSELKSKMGSSAKSISLFRNDEDDDDDDESSEEESESGTSEDNSSASVDSDDQAHKSLHTSRYGESADVNEKKRETVQKSYIQENMLVDLIVLDLLSLVLFEIECYLLLNAMV